MGAGGVEGLGEIGEGIKQKTNKQKNEKPRRCRQQCGWWSEERGGKGEGGGCTKWGEIGKIYL